MKVCRRVVAGLWVVMAIVVGAGCVGGLRPRLEPARDFGGNNPRVCLAMGDSITEGGQVSYPTLLSRMLGMWVVNRGVGGAHSAEGAAAAQRFLAIHKPAYLLILYGANDVLHRRSRDAYIENLRFMIRAARRNRTIPILATMTPMVKGHRGFASTVSQFNDKVRELAKAEGVALCDLELHFMTAGARWGLLMQADGLHPDEQGMQLIAERFCELIR